MSKHRVRGVLVLIVLVFLSYGCGMPYLELRRERQEIQMALKQALKVTCFMPIANRANDAVFTEPEQLDRLRKLMSLGMGRKMPVSGGTTSGGMAITVEITEPCELSIVVAPTIIFSYRKGSDGQPVCYAWFSGQGRLQDLAKECGFVWPLASDIFPLEKKKETVETVD